MASTQVSSETRVRRTRGKYLRIREGEPSGNWGVERLLERGGVPARAACSLPPAYRTVRSLRRVPAYLPTPATYNDSAVFLSFLPTNFYITLVKTKYIFHHSNERQSPLLRWCIVLSIPFPPFLSLFPLVEYNYSRNIPVSVSTHCDDKKGLRGTIIAFEF